MSIIVITLSIIGLIILFIGGVKLYKDHIINSMVKDIKKSPLNHGHKK